MESLKQELVEQEKEKELLLNEQQKREAAKLAEMKNNADKLLGEKEQKREELAQQAEQLSEKLQEACGDLLNTKSSSKEERRNFERKVRARRKWMILSHAI